MKIREKSKFNQILVWTEDSDPPSFEGLVFLWNVYQKSSKSIISVPYELEVNATIFRERYLDLIDRTSNIQIHNREIESYFRIDGDFSLWWMNLVFEKNYGKSKLFSNSIKLTVFEFYLEDFNHSVIHYSRSTTKDLIDYLKVCTDHLLVYKSSNVDLGNPFKIIHGPMQMRSFLPHFLLGLISIFRYVKFCGGIQFVSNGEQRDKGKVHIYDYFFHILTKENEREFKSAYWGTLPDLFNRIKLEVTYSHIFVPSNSFPKIKSAKKKIADYNRGSASKSEHRLVEQVTVLVLCKVILYYIKFSCIYLVYFSFRLKSLLNSKEDRPVLFLWEELKDSIIGSVAIQNLFTFFTVKNQVEVIPKDTRLVYLMENQNWEKVLVYHWKKYIGNRVFGVAHATVRFWDLRYSFRKNLSGFRMNECKPDKIVYNGPLSKKRLLNFGYKEKDLIPGEALRFLGLDSLSKKSNSSKKNKIFLVFTDYLFSVSKFQLDLLDSIEFPYKIIVKPHPACPIERIDFPNLNFEITNERSETLLKNVSIVFTSNVTSASLEAYYLGLPVISARDPKEVNLSPLFGLKNVHFVSSRDELKNSIKDIETIRIQSKRNDVFFTNGKLEKWKNILNVSCMLFYIRNLI